MINLKQIKKSFGENQVLRGIDLQVNRGDVVAVIGPSGSGKSTMLRCLIDLEKVDAGSISIKQQPLVEEGVYVSAHQIHTLIGVMGMVFQQFHLFPHLTVRQNLEIAPRIVKKQSGSEIAQNAEKYLAKVGLSEKADVYPDSLSGGQKQRIAIARALMMTPDILLFDEPTSALDPELTGEVMETICQLAKDRMTMIVVTHEMQFARDVASQVIFMDEGVIVEQGSPEQIFQYPQQERTRAFLRTIIG